jgi:L-asparaginase
LSFFDAVAVAANKDAAGRGVLVVVNDWIHGASSLTKASTTAVQTFLSPLRGLVGTVNYGECEFYRGAVGKNTLDSEFSLAGVTALPRVDIGWPTRTWTARSSTPRGRRVSWSRAWATGT